MTDDKQPFDIDTVMPRIREAIADLPKAALFELAEDGFQSPVRAARRLHHLHPHPR